MGISKRYRAVRLLSVLLISGVLAFLAVGCKTAGPANGTVTVNLINATGHDSATFMFGVYKESTPIAGVADGLGFALISGGESTGITLDPSLSGIMTFSGGGRYYVYAFVDEGGDGSPTSGVDSHYQGSVFTVDGNMTQTLDFASFALVP